MAGLRAWRPSWATLIRRPRLTLGGSDGAVEGGILAEVGVRFRSARARSVLAHQGAKVDPQGEIVHFPAELAA